MRAAIDVLEFHDGIVDTELASVTDNPVLFPEDDVVVQGGDFFGQHVAFVSDALSNAVISIAGHMERAIARLTDPVRSRGLPPMLQPRSPGRQSGFMGAQVTATAILAEMRTHAVPASIQSIPTNADNQDIVTMGTIAAGNTSAQIERLWDMAAIFLLVLAQAAELCAEEGAVTPQTGRVDAVPSAGFAESSVNLHTLVRRHSLRLVEDRPLSNDIERVSAAIRL